MASPGGTFVPDVRTPYWNPPDWAEDPFQEDGHSTNQRSLLNDGRFLITSALRFSNRGGVYKGIDNRTGREVVLKESRPHVELGTYRQDAIRVLEKEHRLLDRLSGTGYFVRPVEFFHAWEHAFLVEEFVFGGHLGHFTIQNNPLYSLNVTVEAVEEYLKRMQPLWLQLGQAIAAAHDRGIALGDLSFTNILVSEGRIRVCDLETAVEEGIDAPVGLHTPGMSVMGLSDRANDYYALGAVVLGSLMLAHGINGFHPPSRRRLLDELSDDLAVPEAVTALVAHLMERPEDCAKAPGRTIESIERLSSGGVVPPRTPRLELPVAQQFDVDRLRELQQRVKDTIGGIVSYLRGTADTGRGDRLFPADLSVFETNPLSVAYGAMGVIYGLHHLDGPVPSHMMDWVLRHPVTNQDYPPGLYVGQAGIAWVLNELGCTEAAVGIMRSARRHELLWQSSDVLHGAAGYGLACLKLWNTGAGYEFFEAATEVGEHLLRACVRDGRGAHWPDQNGDVLLGYARGASGISLFLLYLYLSNHDSRILALGRQALEFDLAQGVWMDGRFSGFPGAPINPSKPAPDAMVASCYWDDGSAGVGTALLRYLAMTPDAEDLQIWRERLATDASRKYTAFPQLFRGSAGLGNFLLDLWWQAGDEKYLMAAWQIAEGILLFRIECAEGVAFPGEQARRESADFASGAAGIGLFLDRLLGARHGVRSNFNFVLDEILSPVPAGATL